ncbi:YeeE/YedE family protein [Roseomonas sp. PWR1]|uniref:YeeE/YedE family protein n=1 Tax=Roseomonas nitratireducens TaxID=2820810 RepID=A0ABS4AU21_9PROT|nr:YeeE/YedE thiosulfate transporter family protein [Neoroseomonas nitratireducens]MBP0464759.1 YeeE/YedE family protein [Neoroseomonas nitratireducens]
MPPLTVLPAPRAHGLGLALGLCALAAIAAGIAARDTALLPVLAVALALGAAFVLLDYGFTGGFRAFLAEGDGRVLGATFIVPAVAALVVLPVGALVPGYQRWVAPIGPSMILGAMIFGVGMMIANGCGSGTLVAAGQGARRMLVALPFFCLGGVAGSLVLPAMLDLPGIEIDLVAALGPWGGLAASEAVLAAGAALVLRGRAPPRGKLIAGSVIGALAAAMFLVSGQPWGITMALTVWGARAVAALGVDLSRSAFWSDPWAAGLLAEPLLAMPGTVADLGLMLGALLAAAATGGLRHGVPIGWRGVLGGVAGGLLMGFGGRLSFGCNVGAFLGGAASGSLHGIAWLACVIPGCALGLRLRPFFGLPRD